MSLSKSGSLFSYPCALIISFVLSCTTVVAQPGLSEILFIDVAEQAGLSHIGRTFGAAWGYYNDDPYPDLWISNHQSSPVLYVNNNGTFTQVANDVILVPEDFQGDFHGAAWADIDNDGDQEILQFAGGCMSQCLRANPWNANKFFINEAGVMVNRAKDLNIEYTFGRSRTPLFFDYDNDGLLDVFAAVTTRVEGTFPTTIFRQNLDGTFVDIGSELTATLPQVYSKFAFLSDLNGDHIPELVVQGDNPDFDLPLTVYDRSGGSLVDVTPTILFPGALTNERSMDVVPGDFNNDGLPDLFITQNQFPHILLLNTGNGLVDVSDRVGFTDITYGFSAVAGDLDNDGDMDLYVLNSDVTSNPTLSENVSDTPAMDLDHDEDMDFYVPKSDLNSYLTLSRNVPNTLYENQGSSEQTLENGTVVQLPSFAAVADAAGADGTSLGLGDTVVVADYNRDGALDLFVTNGSWPLPLADEGPYQLFMNGGNQNNWLEIRLEGVVSNRDGIGAKIFATTGETTQLRESVGTHKYAQDDQVIHFGLGASAFVDQLTIYWPSGTVQTIDGVDANQLLEVREAVSDPDGNQTPVLVSPIPDQIMNNVDFFSLDTSWYFDDPDLVFGDVLTYSALDLPKDLAIDSISGSISGYVSVVGEEAVTVKARDQLGLTAEGAFGLAIYNRVQGEGFIRGTRGNDILFGGPDLDQFKGGDGSDIFAFGVGDRILDFEDGIDKLVLPDNLTFDKVTFSKGGSSNVVWTFIKVQTQVVCRLKNVDPASLTEADFVSIPD